MKLSEIYAVIDGVAPFSISREYCDRLGFYDNSGLLVDCGNEIESVLFSLDCSMRSAQKAKEVGVDLLVTHHPAIFQPIKALRSDSPVTECAKNGISIISAHLNLDSAEGGIDDCLAAALGASGKAKRMHVLTDGGYGSVFAVKKTPLTEFVERAKKVLSTERVVVYGEREVCKVASFCGAGMDEKSVAFALEEGADTLVSSDPKHHLIAQAVEQGLNVVVLTHYAAENYGFRAFYQKIKEKCPLVTMHFFADERLM